MTKVFSIELAVRVFVVRRERRRRGWSWSVSTDIIVNSSAFSCHTEHVEIRDVAPSLSLSVEILSPGTRAEKSDNLCWTVSVLELWRRSSIDFRFFLRWIPSFIVSHRLWSKAINKRSQLISIRKTMSGNDNSRAYNDVDSLHLTFIDERRCSLIAHKRASHPNRSMPTSSWVISTRRSFADGITIRTVGSLTSLSPPIGTRLRSLPWWRTRPGVVFNLSGKSVHFNLILCCWLKTYTIKWSGVSQLFTSLVQAFRNERCRCLVSLPVRVGWLARFLYFMSEFTWNDERTRCARNVLAVEQKGVVCFLTSSS